MAVIWYIRDEQNGYGDVYLPAEPEPLRFRRFMEAWQAAVIEAEPGDTINRVVIDARGEPRVLDSIPVVV